MLTNYQLLIIMLCCHLHDVWLVESLCILCILQPDYDKKQCWLRRWIMIICNYKYLGQIPSKLPSVHHGVWHGSGTIPIIMDVLPHSAKIIEICPSAIFTLSNFEKPCWNVFCIINTMVVSRDYNVEHTGLILNLEWMGTYIFVKLLWLNIFASLANSHSQIIKSPNRGDQRINHWKITGWNIFFQLFTSYWKLCTSKKVLEFFNRPFFSYKIFKSIISGGKTEES